MANTCPTPEKCLFAGCSGECQPPLAAFAPTDDRVAAQLRARDIAWRRASAPPFKLRDPRATRRLLIAS